MAADQPMNNPVSSSAAASRAAEARILDLTSVCVSSGTVRLPLSLQDHFADSDVVAIVNGAELKLKFEAPRTLTGLASFFARNELKANDRVRFEFIDGLLNLSAVKRERGRSGARAGATQQAARPSAATAAREGSKEDSADEADLHRQDRVPAAGEFSNEQVSRAGETNHATVRSVKRVRIEGGAPHRQELPAPQPIDRASSRDVWARRQNPAWRPLDTTDGNPPSAPDDHDSAYSETTVRAIRRSHRGSPSSSPDQQPVPMAAEAPHAAAPSYASDWPLVSRGRLVDKPRQVAPTADLDPYLDARVNVDSEAEKARYAAERDAVGPASPSEAATYLAPRPTGRETSAGQESTSWTAENEQAALVASAQGDTSQRERWGGLLGRLGLTRSANPRRSEQHRERSGGPRAGFSYETGSLSSEPAVPTVYTDRSVWPLDAEYNGDGVAEALLVEPDIHPAPAPTSEQVDPVPARGSRTADVVAEQQREGQDGPPSSGGEALDTLDADIQLLERYLAQPETAAIVRCEDLAGRLNIDYERVSRAFQRMAEDRDRYTPLRGDAYMVRRDR